MKAMIFAAGLGTRLYPLTADRPKALVEVAGVPMLKRVIDNVKAAGATTVVVNVCHFAQKIIDYLADNNNFGMEIIVSDERDMLLETGGGLLKARRILDGNEPVLLHNADICTDADLSRLRLDGAEATLLVADRDSSRRLLFDRTENRLCGWLNTSTGETRPEGTVYDPASHRPLAFQGIHLFDPALFDELAAYASGLQSPAFSITPFYLHCASRGLRITGCEIPGGYRWFDIGRPASLAAAEAAMF